MKAAGLHPLALDVLDELCQTRSTWSSVTLATGLWQRGRLRETGDPAGLIQIVVESLADEGLVKYRLHYPSPVPIDIRVTPLGFVFAGYPNQRPEVGSRAAKSVPIRMEATDFRTLSATAWGGPIERMPLVDHLAIYPEHRAIHPDPSEVGHAPRRDEMQGVSNGAIDQVVKIATGKTMTTSEVAEAIGVGPKRAQAIVRAGVLEGVLERVGPTRGTGAAFVVAHQRPAPPEDAGSVSTRQVVESILRERQDAGLPPIDAPDLMRLVTRREPRLGGLGVHSFVHQLHTMRKRGLISFDETRASSNSPMVVNVRIGNGERERVAEPVAKDTHSYVDRVAERYLARVAETPVPDEPKPVAAETPQPEERTESEPTTQDASSFPLLTALALRAEGLDVERDKVRRYMEAAELIDGIDPEHASELLTAAAEIESSIALSPLEIEYLRYVEAHRG